MVASSLLFLEITPRSSHALSGGPRYLCSSSQRCARGEPLEKQNEARSKNGTVGSIGTNAPITPSAKLRYPRIRYRLFLTILNVRRIRRVFCGCANLECDLPELQSRGISRITADLDGVG